MDLLFTKYLKAGITYRGIQARGNPARAGNTALREAVLNAVIHKDYSTAAPIQISVYDDKLMLWNPGQLPPHWTVAKLKAKHSSQPFNPDIANAFFRVGQIETWGRGIERILEACRQAGLQEPAIDYERTGLWINFSFPAEVADTTGEKTPVETLGKTPGKTLGKTPARIFELLQTNPSLTVPEIAVQLSKSESAVPARHSKTTDGWAAKACRFP